MSDMNPDQFRQLCEDTKRSVLEAKKKRKNEKKKTLLSKGKKESRRMSRRESRAAIREMQNEIKKHLSAASKLSVEMVKTIKSEDGGKERVAAFKAEMRQAKQTIENAYKALAGR